MWLAGRGETPRHCGGGALTDSHLIRREHAVKQLLLPAARALVATLALWALPGIAPRAEAPPPRLYNHVVPIATSKDPQTLAALSAQEAGMPAAIAAALREIGPKIDGARTAALYAPLQPTEPYSGVTLIRDVHYGPHERHVLDVFTGAARSGVVSIRLARADRGACPRGQAGAQCAPHGSLAHIGDLCGRYRR